MDEEKQKEEKISGNQVEVMGRVATLSNGNTVGWYPLENEYLIIFTNAEHKTKTKVKISKSAANALLELMMQDKDLCYFIG